LVCASCIVYSLSTYNITCLFCSKVRKNPSDENGSEASDENGYSEENIATDTQEDAVDI